MAQELPNKFEQHADKYLSAECLIKMVNSGTKLIAENGHSCTLTILNNTSSLKQFNNFRVIHKIYEESSTKSAPLRIKLSLYLFIIISKYPEESLRKCGNEVEDMIKKFMSDASSDARFYARKAYFSYIKVFQEREGALYSSFDQYGQKALTDHNDELGPGIENVVSPCRNVISPISKRGTPLTTGIFNGKEETKRMSLSSSKIPTRVSSFGRKLDLQTFSPPRTGEQTSISQIIQGLEGNQEEKIKYLKLAQEQMFETASLQMEDFDFLVGHIVKLMSDKHHQVVQESLKCIHRLIEEYYETISNHLYLLIPKIVNNSTNWRQSISDLSNELLSLINQNYGSDVIIPYLISILDGKDLLKVKLKVLEYICQIIGDSKDIFSSGAVIKGLVTNICSLVAVNQRDKRLQEFGFILLLSLRLKNSESTLKAITQSPRIEIIMKLCESTNPELYQFIQTQYTGKLRNKDSETQNERLLNYYQKTEKKKISPRSPLQSVNKQNLSQITGPRSNSKNSTSSYSSINHPQIDIDSTPRKKNEKVIPQKQYRSPYTKPLDTRREFTRAITACKKKPNERMDSLQQLQFFIDEAEQYQDLWKINFEHTVEGAMCCFQDQEVDVRRQAALVLRNMIPNFHQKFSHKADDLLNLMIQQYKFEPLPEYESLVNSIVFYYPQTLAIILPQIQDQQPPLLQLLIRIVTHYFKQLTDKQEMMTLVQESFPYLLNVRRQYRHLITNPLTFEKLRSSVQWKCVDLQDSKLKISCLYQLQSKQLY